MKKLILVSALVGVLAADTFASLLFFDAFNYPDGVLTNVSGGLWRAHSGTANQVDVQNGRVNLTGVESEDVNALLAGGPYSSGILYYSMIVNFSVLPQGAGTYFAHFMDNSTGFRARLFATTVGATSGFLRLGVNNGSNPPITGLFPTDLALGNDYLAVVRYDVANVITTLWVNPSDESDPGVTATDGVTALPVHAIALRQSRTTGPVDMGTLTVDNVRVATTFAAAIPEPTGLLALGMLGLLLARRFGRRF